MSAADKHSHHRLILCMGVSTFLTVALLELLTVLSRVAGCGDVWCSAALPLLSIHIEQAEPEMLAEIAQPEHDIPVVPPAQQAKGHSQSTTTSPDEPDKKRDEFIGPLTETTAGPPFDVILQDIVRQSVDQRISRESTRETMWRNTGSVMFRDTGEFDVDEPATIIADRKFRVPVGVLGIGITIGGCFFGIPLAGIPVDKRTTGPNLFYCKDVYE